MHDKLRGLTGGKLPLGDESSYSLEVLKYAKDDKGSRAAVESAIKVFRESFDPLIMDNGRDLIEMVCTCYESPEDGDEPEAGAAGAAAGDEGPQQFDFTQFRTLVLRKGSAMVTVATIRLFGTKFAELPFVATREGYRREGNCRRLITVRRHHAPRQTAVYTCVRRL